MLGAILLQVVLIVLNAIFSSAEIAIISMNDIKLEGMACEGHKAAKRIVQLTKNPAKFLATIQVAITLSGFLGSAYAADNFAGPLVKELTTVWPNIDPNTLNSICVFGITLLISYFSIVFGELIPKRIAMQKVESVAFGTSGILMVVSKLFKPLVWLLTASTNGILKLFHISAEDNEQVTEEEIRMILANSSSNGGIEEGENEIIQKVFDLNDISIKDICTHRKDIIGLYMEDTIEVWEEEIKQYRHSYYPVYGDTNDDIHGILDVKLYFRTDHSTKQNILRESVKQPFFVPSIMKADDLLGMMKKQGEYFSCLLDEYGSFVGVVTLRDIMEIIVGDLAEKDERKEEEIVQIQESEWVIQGTAPLTEVEKQLKINLDSSDHGIFSGFLIQAIGKIPEEGSKMDLEIGTMKIHINNVVNHVVESANVTVIRE